MRLLILSDNYPPERNAPASRTAEHARRWVAAGHDVTVVTGVPNFPEGKVHEGYRNRWRQEEVRDGVQVVRVWTYVTANEGFLRRTLDYLSFMVTAVVAGLSGPKPGVVLATSPQFFTAVAGWLVAAVRRVPFVFEVRDLWPESIRAVGAMKDGPVLRALERLELFLYGRAARVVTVTEAFRRDLVRRGVPAGRIAVVRNGVDASLFSPREADAELRRSLGLEGRFVVSYIGTHGMAHGLDTVLDAAKELEGEGVTFLFLGSGADKARLVDRARKDGIENVRFLDPRPREEMPAYWALSDATVIPLRDQPLFRTTVPSKMFEAMGMGVPMLLGVEGEAKEILEETESGLAFPPEDAGALVWAVRTLEGDAELRRRLGGNGLAAAGRFSRDEAAASMARVLEGTLFV